MSSVARTPTRDELFCAICHSPGPLDIDHIVNRGMGGSQERDVPTNKIALCRTCHELKTIGRIKTFTDASPMLEQPWFYCWRKADSDLVIRVPVRVDERHQCLVPNSEAEATDGSSLEVQQASASELAGEGERSVPVEGLAPEQANPPAAPAGPGLTNDTAVGAQPGPALMDAGGEESQSVKGSPPSVDSPRVDLAAPRPSSSAFSLTSPLTEDWSGLSDDDLQAKYDAAEQMQGLAYLLRCKAVFTYRENHIQTWGKSWTDQAIERFGCSRPYAFAYANLWQIYLKVDTHLREGMASLTDSRSIMQAIGRQHAEDGVKLLEAAVAHVAEYSQPPTLSGLLGGAESVERESHDCPVCGYSHYAVVKDEWK